MVRTMVNRKHKIKVLEQKIKKKFKKLCRRAKYLNGKSTEDILYDLRRIGILLDCLMTNRVRVDMDYYNILEDLYKCETIYELISKLKRITDTMIKTTEDEEEINYELNRLKQRYTAATGISVDTNTVEEIEISEDEETDAKG